MFQRRTMTLLVMLCVLALVSAALPVPGAANAQGAAVTITVAVPSFTADTFSDEVLNAFKSEYPHIDVQVVKANDFIPAATAGIDAHLTAVEAYVSKADVLMVDSRRVAISPEATRAGYFLDLSPLTSVDSQLNSDDFYPAAWQSFQWDRGIWALPSSLDLVVVSYDAEALNQAGVPLPTTSWTLTDYADAAIKLTTKDANGSVIRAGLGVDAGARPAFLRALLPSALFDNTQMPNTPTFSMPELETLLTTWREMQTAGAIGGPDAPIEVTFVSNGLFGLRGNNPRSIVLLPGGVAGVSPQGFAVSAGTTHPDEAYTFARWLTTRGDITARQSIVTARRSLSASGGNQIGGGDIIVVPGPGARLNNLTDEQKALIAEAVEKGLPWSELRYTDWLTVAFNGMQNNGLDARAALQEAEATALQAVTTADSKKGTVAINVATPIPPVTLQAGQVEIKFGLESFASPLPNQGDWDALIADFISNNPQVGSVKMDTFIRAGNLGSLSEDYTCYYMGDNAVSGADLSLLLNIDPFLSADPSFNKDDVLPGVLQQVMRDNKVWAFPFVVSPSILRYSDTKFQQASVPNPALTWTIQDFNVAVQQLKAVLTDTPPFNATQDNGSSLLLLIAAYGGLPFDYSTTPTTIRFTETATVDAIRQVLDLAKQGLISYESLASIGFQRRLIDSESPIYSDVLNTFSARIALGPGGPRRGGQQGAANTDKPIVYPVGTQLYAMTYGVGAGYISAKANSAEAEACYQWLSTVSRRPDLLSLMPARTSLITDPTVATAQGADLTSLYGRIAELMADPRTVIFPSLTAGGGTGLGGFVLQRWLYEAFDTYVLNDGDLDAALKTAEGYAKAYVDCTAALPPYDPATQNQRDYNQQFFACATKADSRLEGMIGGGGR